MTSYDVDHRARRASMRALIFHALGDVRLERVIDPALAAPTDALIQVERAAICGSDLHVYRGREPGLDAGTVLGHEMVGVVVEVGREVAGLTPGERVVCPFTTSCGSCPFCRDGLTARCTRGQLLGWRERGEGLHGAQKIVHQALRRSGEPPGGGRRPGEEQREGRAEQWTFELLPSPAGWRLARREIRAELDGLVHLSIDPGGFRADGLSLRLPDFELRISLGTIFTPGPVIGPTLLVFVGEATVRFAPAPAAEREQLRQFCGAPELVDRVRAALLRVHPADLHEVLVPLRLVRDPQSSDRWNEAEQFLAKHVEESFVVEGDLPRAPWSILPSQGDASLTFRTTRHGTPTFSVGRSEPEDLSLFDRARRRQICLYPSAGRPTRYNEDDLRSVDVLHHDLEVKFDPRRFLLTGMDTLRLRLLAPTTTLDLRLADALRVESVTSSEGGRHLFVRIRDQDRILVSLGVLGSEPRELSLSVRYSGVLRPTGPEQGLLQAAAGPRALAALSDEATHLQGVIAYAHRQPWYPRPAADDHASASLSFEVPDGFTVVSGGTPTRRGVEAERVASEYRQEKPGKSITAVVGRLQPLAPRRAEPTVVRAWAVGSLCDEAARMVDRAAAILAFFSTEFGPCPYPQLNLVVTEGLTPAGHSSPGMVVLTLRPPQLGSALRDDPASFQDIPDFFLAHEIAHQWWGHGVAGENYHERWLSEGMAQYAAALWVRESQGDDAFAGALQRMARWARRKNALGPISLGHRLGHIQGDPQIYRAIVYDKGACVAHQLRSIVGDEAFRRAMTAFQERFRFRKAGSDDLRADLEAASGRELAGHFSDWVYGTAMPTCQPFATPRPPAFTH